MTKHISIGSLEPNFALALLTLLELEGWKNTLADQSYEAQQQLKAVMQKLGYSDEQITDLKKSHCL